MIDRNLIYSIVGIMHVIKNKGFYSHEGAYLSPREFSIVIRTLYERGLIKQDLLVEESNKPYSIYLPLLYAELTDEGEKFFLKCKKLSDDLLNNEL